MDERAPVICTTSPAALSVSCGSCIMFVHWERGI